MRILFVTPYPPSRIRVRGYGFLSILQQRHDVTILAQCASEREMADVEHLRGQGYKVEVVQEEKKQQVLRSGLALLSTEPLQVAYARSKRFANAIQQLCTEQRFDVIHVEHLRGIASLQALSAAALPPIVWDAVDCISLLFQHTMKEAASLSTRAVARLDYRRTAHYEADLLSWLQYTVITSERDRQAMLQLATASHTKKKYSGDAIVSVVPNGVDLDYFALQQQERRPGNLVFSGKMSYHANIAAALYLYQEIMPLIWRERPETTLTIVGSGPPESIRRLARNPKVEVTGYVDDMRPYIGRAEIVVSPMVYSVGIQNKVLEAMALGTPVIAAAQVAGSFGAVPERDLLIADSAREFAEKTLHLMAQPQLRASLRKHGRAYVEAHHSWSAVSDRLIEMYERAIAARATTKDPIPTDVH